MATLCRADGWVKNVLGQAIAGARIYVCNQPADTSFLPPIPLASVFSDPSGMFPVTQPIVSDGFGHFDYYAATGIGYTEVVVFGGQVQQVYTDQVPMGATLTPIAGGTVTNTSGTLTPGQLIIGNGGADIKTGPVFPGIATMFLDGTGHFSTPAGGGGAVDSVFGRTGVVDAAANDYASVANLTLGTPSGNIIQFDVAANNQIGMQDSAGNRFNMGKSAGSPFIEFSDENGDSILLENDTGVLIQSDSGASLSMGISGNASMFAQGGANLQVKADGSITFNPSGNTVSISTLTPVSTSVATLDSSGNFGIGPPVSSLTGSGNKTTLGTNASFKSSPPASPTAGDAFVCTDSPYEYIYNGSVWDSFVFGYLVVEPILSNFTQVNLGGSTVSTTHGGILMNQVANTSNNNGLIQTSSPLIGAGAYFVDMAFIGMMPAVDGGFGPCVIDNSGGSVGSTSNKMINGKWGWEGVSTGTPALNSAFEAQHQNNYNSFNSNHGLNTLSQTGPLTWMRMFDDGTTNMTWYVSSDGYNWIQVYQEGRTAFLTPAHAGVTSSSFDSRSQGSWHLVHFSIHT